METIDQRDARLWKIAMKRAGFKRHLTTYVIVNSFLWFIWWMGSGGHLWPLYPMFGWGIGLAFNYFDAYGNDKNTHAEKEYERLRKEQGIADK